MNRTLLGALIVLVASAVACTSSNTPTQSYQTNAGYDSQYRSAAPRTEQSYGTGGQPGQEAQGDPPITVMLVSLETGDVYPGEDYYVYTVVDNPDNRDLEYVWSVSEGSAREVPEAERGRLATLVEQEYNTASATPAPAEVEETLPGEVPAGEQPAGEQPAGEQPPATPPPAAGPATPGARTAPPGAGLPTGAGGGTAEGGGEYDPFAAGGGGAGGAGGTGGTQPAAQPTGGSGPAAQEPVMPPEIQALLDKPQAELTEEERQRLREYLEEQTGATGPVGGSTGGSAEVSFVLERRVVCAPTSPDEVEDEEAAESTVEEVPEDAGECTETDEPAEPAEAGEAGADAVAPVRDEPSGAANVVEEALPVRESVGVGEEGYSRFGLRGGLAGEYEAWKEDGGAVRRRNLGTYGDGEESEYLGAEESYEAFTLVTDEPYILWTPRVPGEVSIFVKAAYKGEDVTEPRELNLEVHLREPEVELAEDFPDIVREDDPVYVRLDGANLPAFRKGLFTVSFDPDRLSFRDAELGAFFDDAPDASLYYAQPDKLAGKVLLAIDSNTELTELSGDGPLAYLKFKAKTDLTDRTETQLALVMDTSARYILDAERENVLPLPVARPVYRTSTVMPPELPAYNRELTPGTQEAESAGTGAGGAARPAGSGSAPAAALGGAGAGTRGLESAALGGGGATERRPEAPGQVPEDIVIMEDLPEGPAPRVGAGAEDGAEEAGAEDEAEEPAEPAAEDEAGEAAGDEAGEEPEGGEEDESAAG